MPPLKKLIVFNFFLFFSINSFAQTESIQNKLEKLGLQNANIDFSKNYTIKILNKWNDLNSNFHSSIYDSLPTEVWEEILEERYRRSIINNDTVLQIKIALPLAYVLHVQSKFEKGVVVLEFLYKYKNKFNYKTKGVILVKLEEEYRSLNRISNVIQIRKERIEQKYISTFWEIYYSCGLYREAIEDFKLFEPIPPVATRERMSYYNRIGDLFFDAQIYDSAEKYYKIGIKEADIFIKKVNSFDLKDEGYVYYWRGLFYGLVGRCLVEKGQYKTATILFQKQLLYSKDYYRLQGLLYLSNCLLHLGDIKRSKILLDSSYYYISNKTQQKIELDYYKIKSEYFQTINQFDSSLLYLKKFNILKEKIASSIIKNQSIYFLGNLELNTRRKDLLLTQKQLQKTIVKTKIQKNQLIITIVIGFLFATGLVILLILYRQKEKVKKELVTKNLLLQEFSELNLKKRLFNEQLIKELHHRVKNNLQNIYSLLSIQKRTMDDEGSIKLIESMQNRINSMAIVHENLYSNENIEAVDFENYSKNLIENISLSYQRDKFQLHILYKIDPCFLSLEKIILIGLIMNEAISNVFKYALVENKSNELHIILKKLDNSYNLIIKDNGNGFEYNNINKKSVGLKLIKILAMQLSAQYNLLIDNGVEHNLKFCI